VSLPAAVTVKSVRVRPTRNTIGFCGLLLGLWYAALSQGNGAAYALFFLIVALALVSWLHARRNLRGITLRAGRIDSVFAGSELRIPVSITAGAGNFAAGIEIRATAGGEPAKCGFIAAGKTVDVVISTPATQRGVFPVIDVELRSLWPLGILAARCRVALEAPHMVHPTPDGSQSLPEGAPGWKYDRRKGRGDGDEFAGLREFRPGESSRRIDWRAAERTEKLLIKEWEGASGGVRWLDWEDLDASGTEARLAQLARWVLEADRFGAPYGMRIPGAEISPSFGPAQRARCLQALAAFPGAPASLKVPKKARVPEPPILARPFGWLLIVLALAMLPLLSNLQVFSAGLLGVVIVFRYFTRHRSTALRSVPAKLLVIGLGVAGVMLSGGGLVGLEPGLSLLVGLVALKTLETATRRDFFFLLLLAWFLALCGLFISQTFIATLIAFALCILAAATAAMLYSDDSIPKGKALKRVSFIALQGIPVIALFFLFFPRVQGGFRFSFTPSGLGAAGFSEDFDPGSFSKLNKNYDTAFFAEILKGEVPSPGHRYWRGLVLWECDGLQWRRGSVGIIEPRATSVPDDAVRQLIILKPHGARWLFALDRPLFPAKETTLEPGGFLQAYRRINRSTRYQFVSQPNFKDKLLPEMHRRAALQVPKKIPFGTRTLGETLKKAGNDAAILATGIRWFQSQGFTYSLEPQTYEDLDDFLFRRRAGFCAHYAGSFATLMRLAGVPARVVLGYQGGEYNPEARRFIVRQNDAHAWCEVWIEGAGWRRVDLTQQLAPSRIEVGANAYQSSIGETFAGVFRPPKGLADLFGKFRSVWDNLNYQWDLHVVAYDEEAQFEFLANAGMADLPRPVILGGVLVGACVLLGISGLWLRRATRAPPDAVATTWSRACSRIARLSGVVREPWEGPEAYAGRATKARPAASEIIHQVAELYARIRFGAKPPAIAKLREAERRLAAWKERPVRA
jgi:protein-glutamine gamma-glutamyltransferase